MPWFSLTKYETSNALRKANSQSRWLLESAKNDYIYLHKKKESSLDKLYTKTI